LRRRKSYTLPMFNQGPMRRECSTCDDSTANAECAKVNQRPFRFKRTSLGGNPIGETSVDSDTLTRMGGPEYPD
jgi:hypothetical protein